jgi:hypothetical protein
MKMTLDAMGEQENPFMAAILEFSLYTVFSSEINVAEWAPDLTSFSKSKFLESVYLRIAVCIRRFLELPTWTKDYACFAVRKNATILLNKGPLPASCSDIK